MWGALPSQKQLTSKLFPCFIHSWFGIPHISSLHTEFSLKDFNYASEGLHRKRQSIKPVIQMRKWKQEARGDLYSVKKCWHLCPHLSDNAIVWTFQSIAGLFLVSETKGRRVVKSRKARYIWHKIISLQARHCVAGIPTGLADQLKEKTQPTPDSWTLPLQKEQENRKQVTLTGSYLAQPVFD